MYVRRGPARVMVILSLWGMMGLAGPAGLTVAAVAAQTAQSDEAEPLGILVSGPGEERGLPFLSTNSIRHFRGRYETPAGNVVVYYTEEEIVAPAVWEEDGCGQLRLFTFPSTADSGHMSQVAYLPTRDYAWFFSFQGDAADCRFIETFLSRFRYFLSLPSEGGSTAVPPFPAVLSP